MDLGKNAGTISSATGLSRILGLVRDQIFAALIGAGFHADAYVIAFRIPNLLRDLFAEGALSHAFVPTLTEYQSQRSPEETQALANLVLGALLLIVGFLTLLGIVFAPFLVKLIAPGFASIAGKAELTVQLTRIMFPFLLVVAVSALFMGVHNVRGHFTLPALAPVMFNVVSIIVGVGLWLSGAGLKAAVIGWSVGTLIGGMGQAVIQLPKLVRGGWKISPTLARWKSHPGLKQIALLMLPALIAVSGTQVNVLVNTILASLLEQGSPSWLNYAFRLMQLPIGLFGVAISIVTLAAISKDVASNSMDSFRENLFRSLNLVFLLTIPCAVGLWILGIPIVRLIFERGAFTSTDTVATAAALSMYALGLAAYAAVKVLAPSFFALKDSKVPMIASLTGIAVNVVFNLLVYRHLRHPGLALGTSLGMAVNLAILFGWFHLRYGGIPWGMFAARLVRIALACVVLGFVAFRTHEAVQGQLPGLAGSLLDTLVPISAASLAYFFILALLRHPELSILSAVPKRMMKKLLGR